MGIIGNGGENLRWLFFGRIHSKFAPHVTPGAIGLRQIVALLTGNRSPFQALHGHLEIPAARCKPSCMAGFQRSLLPFREKSVMRDTSSMPGILNDVEFG
jgi:hypothetical protein